MIFWSNFSNDDFDVKEALLIFVLFLTSQGKIELDTCLNIYLYLCLVLVKYGDLFEYGRKIIKNHPWNIEFDTFYFQNVFQNGIHLYGDLQ